MVDGRAILIEGHRVCFAIAARELDGVAQRLCHLSSGHRYGLARLLECVSHVTQCATIVH